MRIIPVIPLADGSVQNLTYADAIQRGIAADVAGAALKLHALSLVSAIYKELRQKLSTDQPAIIAEWTLKQKIADDPSLANAAMLASLDAEAAARGTDRAGLFAIIQAKATALEETVLAVSAMEAVTFAGIEAIDDSAADVEAQIDPILQAAQTDADAAYTAALAQINGGS